MTARVLVVDDEPSILKCFETVLECQDFAVRTAGSAAAAIAALDSSEFDIVITDMVMETETAGYDVVVAAQKQRYGPEVVIVTGSQIPESEWKKRGVRNLFNKAQATPVTVGRAVRKIFDERGRDRAVVHGEHQSCA